MRTGNISEVIRMNEVINTEVSNLAVTKPQNLPTSGVKGDHAKVKLVLRLEHDLLLRHL